MRLLLIGHSLLHPRQEALSLELARRGHEVLAIGPAQWSDETYQPREAGTYRSCPLQVVGGNIFTLTLSPWTDRAREFKPDLIYVQQEPWSVLASQVCAYSRETGVPYCIFSWENRGEVGGDPATEARVLSGAAGVVAGNSLARKRMEGVLGKPLERCLIAPQTGIHVGLFQPMKEGTKDFDLVFHGRLVREKGVAFIEEAARSLELSLLIVGGRGTFQPRYYKAQIPWTTYENLPRLIGRAKVSATCSWAYKGYAEQWSSAVGDALACGLTVVRTDNGSLNEHYGDSPAIVATQGDQTAVTEAIADAVRHPRAGGREWVIKHHSVESITARVDGFFNEVLDGP